MANISKTDNTLHKRVIGDFTRHITVMTSIGPPKYGCFFEEIKSYAKPSMDRKC
jgi:hypothetical protein